MALQPTIATPEVDAEHALGLLRDMVRIRRFEEKSAELYSAAKIRGFLHLYIGEEAVAVGAMRALTPDDSVVATYREHGHALLRGVSANSIMAEMYGKQQGCSRGRGGEILRRQCNRRWRLAARHRLRPGRQTATSSACDRLLLRRRRCGRGRVS